MPTGVRLEVMLEMLFPDSRDFVELRGFDVSTPGGFAIARAFFDPTDDAVMTNDVQDHAHLDLYWWVAARGTLRGEGAGALANCTTLAALFVDLDFKSIPEPEARARLWTLPCLPSLTIASGAGLH